MDELLPEPGVLIPTPIQHEDSDELLKWRYGYVWSKPGTGKTLTSLLAAKKGGYTRGVVICPPIAIGMWADNIRTQLGFESYEMRKGFSGSRREEKLEMALASDWLVTSYTLAHRNKQLMIDFLKGGEMPLILDEAHYLKSRDAIRTQAILGHKTIMPKFKSKRLPVFTPEDLNRMSGIAHHADVVWQLTGTPMTRWPDDLWTQLSFGRQEVLEHYNVASYDQFVRMFCVTKEMVGDGGYKETRIIGAKNRIMLGNLIRDCKIIARTLEEAAKELPPITSQYVPIVVKVSKADEIEIGDADLQRELNIPDSPFAVAYRELGMKKIEQVTDYLLENRHGPTLVGFWHLDVGQQMASRLKRLNKSLVVKYVDGSTPSETRDKVRDEVNAGSVDILLGQMGALSTSWNLQEAVSHVVVAEELASPSAMLQFYSRVYRKGQKNHVQLDLMRSNHPLDKALSRIRARKNTVMEDIDNAARS